MHVHVHLENNVLLSARIERRPGVTRCAGPSCCPPTRNESAGAATRYCPADDLACGNGTIRTPHPCELFGDDWLEWSHSRRKAAELEV